MVENQEVGSAALHSCSPQAAAQLTEGRLHQGQTSPRSLQDHQRLCCPSVPRSAGGSGPVSSQTTAFLCELRRFLGDFLQQDRRQSPPLQLTSLQSLPAVSIGPSSSEALLAALINSSTLTVFSFAGCCSSPAQVHAGELSLSSPLQEELRQRLATAVGRSLEVMRQEEVGGRAAHRLGRLLELSEALKTEPATGDDAFDIA